MLFFVLCSQLEGNGTVIIKNVLHIHTAPLLLKAVLCTYQHPFSAFLVTQMEGSRSAPISYPGSPECTSRTANRLTLLKFHGLSQSLKKKCKEKGKAVPVTGHEGP
jgi:hypothetical protein